GGHPQVAAHQVVAALTPDVAVGAPGLAVAIDAAGHLDGERAEGGDALVGGVEAVAVEDEGRPHGGGDGADARDGVEGRGPGPVPVAGGCVGGRWPGGVWRPGGASAARWTAAVGVRVVG